MKRNNNVVLSGMRPTGRLHLGNYFGALRNWVWLQNQGIYNCFYFVADLHAMTTDFDNVERIKKDTLEMVIDWLSVGLDPNKSIIYVQSQIPQVIKLYFYLTYVVPLGWLLRNPTYKDFKENMFGLHKLKEHLDYNNLLSTVSEWIRGLKLGIEGNIQELSQRVANSIIEETIVAYVERIISSDILKKRLNISKKSYYKYNNFAFLGYPVLQAADIFIVRGKYVPVGKDQLPHIELSRDIAKRFNRIYGDVLTVPEALLSEIPYVPGIDKRKMSKSYGNHILLTEPQNTLKEKINKMYTDPQKVRKTDRGHPEGCVVFQFHKLFAKDSEEIKNIELICKKGQISCTECKMNLFKKIDSFIQPIRERREQYKDDISGVKELLIENSRKVREIADDVIALVEDKVGLVRVSDSF